MPRCKSGTILDWLFVEYPAFLDTRALRWMVGNTSMRTVAGKFLSPPGAERRWIVSVSLALANVLPIRAGEHRTPGPGLSIVPSLGIVRPGIAAGLDLNVYGLGGFNHKVRIHAAEEAFGVPDSSAAHTELGYLIGKWKRRRFGYVSAMTGISVVETTKTGREIIPPACQNGGCSLTWNRRYEVSKSTTVGIPFQLEAVLVGQFIGAGISILGNFNLDRTFGGIVVEVPFGWIPRPEAGRRFTN